jgi:hypothetical protein
VRACYDYFHGLLVSNVLFYFCNVEVLYLNYGHSLSHLLFDTYTMHLSYAPTKRFSYVRPILFGFEPNLLYPNFTASVFWDSNELEQNGTRSEWLYSFL